MKQYRDKRKTSFKLFYPSTEQVIDNFDDAKAGKMYKAIARYEMYEELPPEDYFVDASGTEDGALKMLFSMIRNELDRNFENWEKTCEKNKENRNAYKNKNKNKGEADEHNHGDEP